MTLIFCSFLIFQVNAQDNKPLIIKKTATWCPFCGTWGWDFMENTLEEYQNHEAVVIAIHHSGDLQTPTAKAFATNLGGQSQPTFYFNNDNMSVIGTNYEQRFEEMKEDVTNFNSSDARFLIEMDGSFNSNLDAFLTKISLTINSTSSDNDIYLGAYVLENDVTNNQASLGVVDHPRVLKSSMTQENFGLKVFDAGDLTVGEFYTGNFALVDSNPMDKDFDIVCIVWEKVDDKYIAIQAEILPEVSFTSSNDDITLDQTISVYVDENKSVHLSAELSQLAEKSNIQIFNQNGQSIYTETTYSNSQKVDQTIDLSAFSAGTYILQLDLGYTVLNERFILAH